MLTVLGRTTSINVRKVLWTADELSVPYRLEVWGKPHRDPDAPEFRALNPNAQVPVIRDGDFVLWESSAIVRYLIEKHSPSHLVPTDLRTRAIAEQWFAWQATDLNRSWNYAAMALVRKLPGYDDQSQIAQSLAQWTAKMRVFEQQLAETRAHAAGDAFTFADISLGLSMHRWFGGDFERLDLPHAADYYDRVRARPAARPHFDPATP